ncbi:MAG: nuclear transport factor 2 family protein [bacterium]
MDDAHAAIATLVYAYAERLDAGDFAGFADFFAASTLRSERNTAVRRGRADVLSMYGDVVVYDGVPCTQHVITNLLIEFAADGQQASSRCAFSVLQARPELPLQVILAGRYVDRFARDGGGWRFDDRLIRVDLVGDLRWHYRRTAT